MNTQKLKTFTLDLRRMARGSWFCGSRACTMGQFAEQHCDLKNWKPRYAWSDKSLEASTRCSSKLGTAISDKIIDVNDSHRSWDDKLIIMRKLFREAGYRLVVKR